MSKQIRRQEVVEHRSAHSVPAHLLRHSLAVREGKARRAALEAMRLQKLGKTLQLRQRHVRRHTRSNVAAALCTRIVARETREASYQRVHELQSNSYLSTNLLIGSESICLTEHYYRSFLLN